MTKAQKENRKKFANNLLKFTAPMLGVFFIQLSQGVEWKLAGGVALLALWGALADFLKKIK